MAEAAVAEVTIIPVSKGAQGQIARELGGEAAGRTVGAQVGSGLSSALGSVLQGTATTVVAAAAAGIGTALVRGFGRLESLDQARAKLTGLGHDAGSVQAIMDNALASVRGTAFGMDDAATVAASAVAAGIAPGEDLTRTLSLVADAATIAGTDMGSMGAIFNKAAASNKIQMDTINQLHDAGVPALAFLAEQMGVTAEEASSMASRGEIDFATFQAAMEAGLGGAAQSSGDTFTGAMANVFASLGRIGANLQSGFFPQLAPMFQGMQAAMAPLEESAAGIGEAIGSTLAPAFDRIGAFFQTGAADGFASLKESLSGISGIIGPAAGAFGALGASGLAPLLRMVPGLGGFAGVLGGLAGPVGIAAAAFLGLVAVSPELQDAFGGLFEALGAAAEALGPSLETVGTVLTGALVIGMDALVDVLVAVVDGISALVEWITPAADLLTSLGVGILAVVTAMKTWQIITAVVAAAQGVLNVIMAANPIGIVVIAIAALVAGLIWFFTQTELGQEIWANFTQFLGEAWANVAQWFMDVGNGIADWWNGLWTGISDFFTTVWTSIVSFVTTVFTNVLAFFTTVGTAIVTWWNGLWQGIVDFFVGIWNGIVAFITLYIQTVLLIITTVVTIIMTVWNAVWSGISAFFTGIWESIVAGVTMYINFVLAIVTAVVTTISAVWNAIWSGIASFFQGIWDGIVATVNTVGSIFSNAFDGIAGIVEGAFNGVVGIVKGVINSIIRVVNNAIDGINDVAGAIGGALGLDISVGHIPLLAEGGIVSGPTLAMVGEGRYQEAVVPLGPKFWDALGGGGGRGDGVAVTQNVYPAPGMSEQTIADVASQRLAWKLR